jgi:hypothetical protein
LLQGAGARAVADGDEFAECYLQHSQIASGIPSVASGIPSFASAIPSVASGIPSFASGISNFAYILDQAGNGSHF